MSKIDEFQIPNFNDESSELKFENITINRNEEIDYSTLKNEKKRKRKRRRWIRVIIVVLLFVGYLFTPFSNVNEIQVSDTMYVSKEQIIELSKLDKNSKFILIHNFFKPKLNHDFIEDYKIINYYNGTIRLEVTEKRAFGYIVSSDSIDLLVKDGKLVSFPNLEDYILSLPKINSSDEEFLKLLSEGMEKLDQNVISRISEIDILVLSYEKNAFILHMEDGNKIYGSTKDLHLMKNYNNILESVNEKNQCIQLDESTNSAFKFKCP